MLERTARWITRGFELLIVACLAIMGLLVFGNVVLRYAFNTGIAVSEELSRLLFVWLIFMGAVLASAQRIHIGFDTLLHAVGPRGVHEGGSVPVLQRRKGGAEHFGDLRRIHVANDRQDTR